MSFRNGVTRFTVSGKRNSELSSCNCIIINLARTILRYLKDAAAVIPRRLRSYFESCKNNVRNAKIRVIPAGKVPEVIRHEITVNSHINAILYEIQYVRVCVCVCAVYILCEIALRPNFSCGNEQQVYYSFIIRAQLYIHSNTSIS